MRNYLKYSSLKFREHADQCIPRGPSFRHAGITRVQLSQGQLEFRASRHAPERVRGHAPGQMHVISRRVYAPGDHRSVPAARFQPSGSWLEDAICSRSWGFYGPWFTGGMGRVHLYMAAVRPKDINPDISFLYPAAFESAVLGYMTARWGCEIYDEVKGIAYYRAPLHWTPVVGLPVPAVRFAMEPVVPSGEREIHLFFPVARDWLVHLSFAYSQSCAGSWAEQDAKISPQPMLELIDDIIGSVRLTPSPQLQTEIDQAKSQRPDYRVSAECPPLQWPADVDADGITILEYQKGRYAKEYS